MDEKSKELAQRLVDQKKTEYIKTFTVDDNQNDQIVVIVKRTTQVAVKSMRTNLKEFTEVVAGPIGNPCGCCGGTGRQN